MGSCCKPAGAGVACCAVPCHVHFLHESFSLELSSLFQQLMDCFGGRTKTSTKQHSAAESRNLQKGISVQGDGRTERIMDTECEYQFSRSR